MSRLFLKKADPIECMWFLTDLLFSFVFDYRNKRGKENPSRRGEKFGFFNGFDRVPNGKETVWINAVSIGEASSALGLINELQNAGYQVLLTTTTIGASIWVKDHVPQGVIHNFTPYPSTVYFRRFLKIWKPRAAIFVESEIWPNLIFEIKKHCPFWIVNGKLSDKSYKKWRIVNRILPFFKSIDMVFAGDEKSSKRFKLLGVKRVRYLGNLKFDSVREFLRKTLEIGYCEKYSKMHSTLISQGKKVITFANFRKGEYRLIPEVLDRNHAFGVVIIRKIELMAECLEELGIGEYFLSSEFKNETEYGRLFREKRLLIVDEIGNIGCYYMASDLVIIGGSFVPKIGGHSPIEALACGKPVIIGDYHKNCAGIVADCLANDAIVVSNCNDLTNDVQRVLSKNWHGNIDYINQMTARDISLEIVKSLDFNKN